MGIIMSKAVRKMRRFNVENRAHRLLDRKKLDAAPKFEATKKELQRAIEENPNYLEEQSKINTSLDNRLKQVFVTSKDTAVYQRKQKIDDIERNLPLDRHIVDDFEYGHKEPDRVTPGRCSLRQAIQFINKSVENPEEYTLQKIAAEYRLKENNVENILKYFKPFAVHIPEVKQKDNILIQYTNRILNIEAKTKDSSNSAEK